MTGVRVTVPAAPKPSSVLLVREASSIAGKPAGNVVPTVPAAWPSATAASRDVATATLRRERGIVGISSKSGSMTAAILHRRVTAPRRALRSLDLADRAHRLRPQGRVGGPVGLALGRVEVLDPAACLR